eukprot:7315477-Pyramimonas_sp.AAC.1
MAFGRAGLVFTAVGAVRVEPSMTFVNTGCFELEGPAAEVDAFDPVATGSTRACPLSTPSCDSPARSVAAGPLSTSAAGFLKAFFLPYPDLLFSASRAARSAPFLYISASLIMNLAPSSLLL